MDFWPVFEPGLWNAWLLMLLYVLMPPLSVVFLGERVSSLNRIEGEENVMGVTMPLWIGTMFGGLAYSVFVPLQVGTPWLWVGLAVYLVGYLWFAGTMWGIARAPVGGVFTEGAYRFSRNPMYVGTILIYVGVGIAGLSWVFIALAGVVLGITKAWIPIEEASCLERHGEAYRHYMDRTPRWLGRPRSSLDPGTQVEKDD